MKFVYYGPVLWMFAAAITLWVAPVFAAEATVTIVGHKGEPAQIIDNKTGTVTEQDTSTLRVNTVSPIAVEHAEERTAEEEAEVKADEAKDAEAAKAEAEKKKKAEEEKAKADAAAAKAAAEKAKLEKAEAEMKSMGWINQTEDGKYLFNPNTMQFLPREDVLQKFLPADPKAKSDGNAAAKPPSPSPAASKDDSDDGPF